MLHGKTAAAIARRREYHHDAGRYHDAIARHTTGREDDHSGQNSYLATRGDTRFSPARAELAEIISITVRFTVGDQTLIELITRGKAITTTPYRIQLT